MFAAGGYTREALGDPPPWLGGAFLGSGAVAGLGAALLAGRSPLSDWVRPAAIGALTGVAAVVFLTLGIVCSLGGRSSGSKGDAVLAAGLVCGVPIGLISGI